MPVNLQLERSFDPEHHDIVDLVTQFVERRSDPGGPPVLDRPTLAELAELALIGTGLPVQHGGAGIDDIRIAAAIRVGSCRAGASGLGIALTECAHVALTVLDSVADGPARDRWYADIVAGRVLVALVVAGDGVTATPSDRGLTLSGRATAGVGVAGADLLVVAADAADGLPTFDDAGRPRSPSRRGTAGARARLAAGRRRGVLRRSGRADRHQRAHG